MQNNNTELFLYIDGTWKALEVADNIPFPMSYSIADIRDITKRNSTYSKTLEIPGTPANNDLLNYIFDIANVSTFNVNRKVRCTIVVDTIPIISDAFFQLTDIKSDDNIHFVYECLVIGDTDSIFKDLENRLMTDMYIPEIGHDYTEANIVSSWSSQYSNGYYYGLVDYGYNWDSSNIGVTSSVGVKIEQMKPGLYVKYLWKKLFSLAGWTYQSTFIDSLTSPWNDMILLSGNELVQSLTFSYYNTFRAALSTNKVFTLGHTYSRPWSPNGGNPSPYFNSPLQWGYTGSNINVIQNPGNNALINQTDNTVSVVSSAMGTLRDYDNYASFTSSRLPFSNDTTSPNGDPGNNWDTTVWEYTVPNINSIQVLGGSFEITIPATASLYAANSLVDNFNNTTAAAAPQFIFFDVLLFRSTVYSNNNGAKQYMPINDVSQPGWNGSLAHAGWKLGYIFGSTHSVQQQNFLIGADPYSVLLPGRTYIKQFQTIQFNWSGVAGPSNPYAVLQPGEKLWMKMVARAGVAGNVAGATIGPSFSVTLNTSNTYIWNAIDPVLISGQPLDAASMLPKQFKQIDFFTGLVKMFNLYIEPHKTISKRLIIEPRDIYYSTGTERNWTMKVDIDQEVHQQVIAETQAKQLFLTYKLDKDAYNDNYNNQFKEVYGQYKYVVDNDFIKGDTKVEVPFASTPVTALNGPNAWTTDSIILPVIAKNDAGALKKTDFIPRILFKATAGTVTIQDPTNYWKFNSTLRSVYPYLGHFNHPTNADDDLNFGQPQKLYYNLNNLTGNNLFTNYYEKQLNELTDRDSRIVTLNMVLTPQDMNDFSFRDRIIIDGISSGAINYFRINKIEYDPTSKGTFKVELLKAKDIPKRPRNRWIFNGAVTLGTTIGIAIALGDGNITYTTTDVFIGADNIADVGGTKSLTIGNNNYIGAYSRNSMILGDRSKIAPGSSNTLVIGDNIVTKSGQSGLIMNTQPIISINYIDAGLDMILNPYPLSTTINYINSGLDTILPIGGNTLIYKIDSGVDEV